MASPSRLPYELLTILRISFTSPLLYTRDIQILYLRCTRIISRRVIPQVRRQLRWAVLFAFLRAYISFWRRVILDPKSGFEKVVNRNGAWLLLAALRERLKKRLNGGSSSGGKSEASVAGSTRSTSPEPASPRDSVAAAEDIDPVLTAVKHLVPSATGYKVIFPKSSDSDRLNKELGKNCSKDNYEVAAYFQDGLVRNLAKVEDRNAMRNSRIVTLVLMEDVDVDKKRIKGAVTVDMGTTRKDSDCDLSFAEALDV